MIEESDMKAWFDQDGFIHVTAETAAEKFAMRWNRDNLQQADANGIVLHEDEPKDFTVGKCENIQTSDEGFPYRR